MERWAGGAVGGWSGGRVGVWAVCGWARGVRVGARVVTGVVAPGPETWLGPSPSSVYRYGVRTLGKYDNDVAAWRHTSPHLIAPAGALCVSACCHGQNRCVDDGIFSPAAGCLSRRPQRTR